MTDESGPVALPAEAAPPSPPPSTAPRTRRPRRALTTGKVLVALVTCLVFLVTGTGWGATLWLDRQLRDVLALDPDSDSITDAGHNAATRKFCWSDRTPGQARSSMTTSATQPSCTGPVRTP
ncbi:MAG TPA: hypothetical protein VHH34_01665 [Pseudonocardiaceae bacterium]|nr:hypothetical protein [Pseudonocardiaceae bacterium]